MIGGVTRHRLPHLPCKQVLTRHLLGQTKVNLVECIPLTWKTAHKKDTFHFFIVNCNTLSSNSLLYTGLPIWPATQASMSAECSCQADLQCHVRHFDHITPTLFSLHWLPIRYRIQFKNLLFTYKALNGFAPAYITELLHLQTIPRYNLRCKVVKKKKKLLQ